MTYTVVYADFVAATFAAAAADCLRDPAVFAPGDPGPGGRIVGGQIGYALDHWEWTPDPADPLGLRGTLRAWFR